MELGYTLDIKAKQITFTVKQEELDETAKELGDNVTSSEVEQAINSVLTTFNYSVDGTELTLTEWDYGDQMSCTDSCSGKGRMRDYPLCSSEYGSSTGFTRD